MQDYDKVPVGDEEEGGGGGGKREGLRPIAWARRHMRDCCGCVGDCVTCTFKTILAIVLPVIAVLIIVVVVLAVVLGMKPAEVIQAGKDTVESVTGTKPTHHMVSSAFLMPPWTVAAAASSSSLDGWIDLPPGTTLAVNMSWQGAPDLVAVMLMARRRSDGRTATLGALPVPTSLTPGLNAWPCSMLKGICTTLVDAQSNGDAIYVVLLRALPVNEANVIVTAIVY